MRRILLVSLVVIMLVISVPFSLVSAKSIENPKDFTATAAFTQISKMDGYSDIPGLPFLTYNEIFQGQITDSSWAFLKKAEFSMVNTTWYNLQYAPEYGAYYIWGIDACDITINTKKGDIVLHGEGSISGVFPAFGTADMTWTYVSGDEFYEDYVINGNTLTCNFAWTVLNLNPLQTTGSGVGTITGSYCKAK